MGVGFVFLAWLIVGSILALLAAAVFASVTALATRGSPYRKRAVLLTAVFPFAGLGWASGVFILQAIVNQTLLHRDPGIGDAWECPLPNGYAILMIDVTDHGTVYNPKTQPGGGVGEQEDAVFGVRNLQVMGRYILGDADPKPIGESDKDPQDRVFFFLLDTQSGARTNYSDYASLLAGAQRIGIQPKLEPIFDVYSKYRFTWFEVFAGILSFGPLLIAATLLVLWVLRLRKEASTHSSPSVKAHLA